MGSFFWRRMQLFPEQNPGIRQPTDASMGIFEGESHGNLKVQKAAVWFDDECDRLANVFLVPNSGLEIHSDLLQLLQNWMDLALLSLCSYCDFWRRALVEKGKPWKLERLQNRIALHRQLPFPMSRSTDRVTLVQFRSPIVICK